MHNYKKELEDKINDVVFLYIEMLNALKCFDEFSHNKKQIRVITKIIAKKLNNLSTYFENF
ncbi:hypothetical protein IJ541_01985 [bacterium]|nr:hypothetical protein [bacterium]